MKAGVYLARALHAYGVTCVFNMEAMLRITIRELEQLGVRTVMAHSKRFIVNSS